MRAQRRPLALAATCTTALMSVGWVAAAPPAAADNGPAIASCTATATGADGMLDASTLHSCMDTVLSSIAQRMVEEAEEPEPAEDTSPAEATAQPTQGTSAAQAASLAPEAVAEAPVHDWLAGAFAALRRCESGGNYTINTGNGYYGAYQFAPSTWQGLGYSGYPHQASPAVQDQAARELQARYGWGQWPACSAALGLR